MKLKDLLQEEYNKDINYEELSKATRGNVILNANGDLYCKSGFNLNTDYVIELFIEKAIDTHMKYKFNLVRGDFNVQQQNLTTFENFPFDVKGDIEAWGNHFTSLEGITPHIGGVLDICLCNGLKSFKNIGKMVKKCKSIIVPAALESNILSVLLIPNLERIHHEDNEVTEREIPELAKALQIMQHQLNGDRDVMDGQEELIQAGLREFARL